MDSIEAELTELIRVRLEDEEAEIAIDKPLRDLGLDSMASMEILFDVEDKLDVEVPDMRELSERLQGEFTVQSLAKLVRELKDSSADG